MFFIRSSDCPDALFAFFFIFFLLIWHPSHCSCESRLWPLFCSNDHNSVWPKNRYSRFLKICFGVLEGHLWQWAQDHTRQRTTNYNWSVSRGTIDSDGPAPDTEFCLKYICGFRLFHFIGLWMNKTKTDSQLEAGPSPIVVPLETLPYSVFCASLLPVLEFGQGFMLFAWVFGSCTPFALVGHR